MQTSDFEDTLERQAFFDLFRQAFERAERCAGRCEWNGQLGGRAIRLIGAGDALLAKLTPALQHQFVEETVDPDLTICLWNDDSIPLPSLLACWITALRVNPFEWLDGRHCIKHYCDDRFRAVYRLGPVNILSLFDRERSLALYYVPDSTDIPYWEIGSPLQTILNWWAESRGLQYLHAAAIGNEKGVLLLTGPGGSGKSTTALACLDSDLGYIADDYCLASNQNGPYVHSLYNTAKLVGAADFERFPRLAARVTNRDRGHEDKALLHLDGIKLLSGGPIRAVVVPTIRGGIASHLERMSGGEALRALAPTTLFQLPGSGQNALRQMTDILRSAPCYRLCLGTDIAALPGVLGSLLEELAAC